LTSFVVESRKNRAVYLPEDLKNQWKKDRLKKAAFKKARAQARLEAAVDPLSGKKGGKKGRKAMLAAARVDPTITILPNRIIDMVTLVQQIKRFIDDEERKSMALPPTDKHTRKNIHDLAQAFNMTSISKGHGEARYTTLTKTSRSGFDVDENKVAKIVRKNGVRDPFVKKGKTRGDSFAKKGQKARTGTQAQPRPRDGDEVGKVKCSF
jgi:R3H domain